jgi:hypothetical protein
MDKYAASGKYLEQILAFRAECRVFDRLRVEKTKS